VEEEDLYSAMISKITDKVIETASAWQNKSLSPVYPNEYFLRKVLYLAKTGPVPYSSLV